MLLDVFRLCVGTVFVDPSNALFEFFEGIHDHFSFHGEDRQTLIWSISDLLDRLFEEASPHNRPSLAIDENSLVSQFRGGNNDKNSVVDDGPDE